MGGTHQGQLAARGARELLVPGRRCTAGGAALLAGVQLAQTLPAQHGLARGAGGEGGVEVRSALGAGSKERQGDPMPRRPMEAYQGRVAFGACIGRTENRSPAPRAVADEKGVAGGAERCARQQTLAAGGAVKVELQRAGGAAVLVVGHRRAAGRADRLPTIGAEPILYVQGQAAGRAPAGERLLVLLVGRRLVSLIKAGLTMRAARRVERDLAVARPADKAVGRATFGAGKGGCIEEGAAVDAERLAATGALFEADRISGRA